MMNLLKSNLFLRKNIFFLLLILIAILPRFIFLSNVPNAINQDELHYALDAKSFFLTGKDVLGQTSLVDVLLFNSPKSEPLQAELQYFFEIPVLGLMGFSMTNLVLPNVLLGILTVVLIYLITLKLFDKNTALLHDVNNKKLENFTDNPLRASCFLFSYCNETYFSAFYVIKYFVCFFVC